MEYASALFGWRRLVEIAISDYHLSFVACAVMVGSRAWGTRRIRKYRTLPFVAHPVWPLAFYWPLYVWGLEAPESLWLQVFAGADYAGTKEACAGISVAVWAPIYASALPLLLIAHVGAVTQALVNEYRCPDLAWQVSLPFPVVIAVLGVFFVETAMSLLFAMLAVQWR